MACAREAMGVNPIAAAIPLMEWARRNSSLISSRSRPAASPRDRSAPWASMCSRASLAKRSRKSVVSTPRDPLGCGGPAARAGHDFREHLQDPVGRERLDDEVLGAGRDRFHDQGFLAHGAAHHDHGRGVDLEDLAGGLDAVELRHDDVHGHELGAELAESGNRLAAVAGLADHLVAAAGVVQDVLDHGAHEHGVVHDQHPDRRHGVSSSPRPSGRNPARIDSSTRARSAGTDSRLSSRSPTGSRAWSHEASSRVRGSTSSPAEEATSTTRRTRIPRWSKGSARTTPYASAPPTPASASPDHAGPAPAVSRSRSRSIKVTMRPCTSASPAMTPGARGTARTPRRRATSRTSFALRPYHSERASKGMIGSCTPVPSRSSTDLKDGDQVFQGIGSLRQLLRRSGHLLHRGGLLLGGGGGLFGPDRKSVV